MSTWIGKVLSSRSIQHEKNRFRRTHPTELLALVRPGNLKGLHAPSAVSIDQRCYDGRRCHPGVRTQGQVHPVGAVRLLADDSVATATAR